MYRSLDRPAGYQIALKCPDAKNLDQALVHVEDYMSPALYGHPACIRSSVFVRRHDQYGAIRPRCLSYTVFPPIFLTMRRALICRELCDKGIVDSQTSRDMSDPRTSHCAQCSRVLTYGLHRWGLYWALNAVGLDSPGKRREHWKAGRTFGFSGCPYVRIDFLIVA